MARTRFDKDYYRTLGVPPKRYRNEHGQLTENSPYSERDIHRPESLPVHDERGEFRLLVKKENRLLEMILDHHPFDVVGWDGMFYPWAFNIEDFEPITVAGLAKREEELHVPDREEPIRLERRDPALQLVQMVRDETHRFAVSSHRRRRSKRTLHSELDDLPGIGERRKRLLIERFGSVSAIKQASALDLINVLGKKVGQTLYDELHVR